MPCTPVDERRGSRSEIIPGKQRVKDHLATVAAPKEALTVSLTSIVRASKSLALPVCGLSKCAS
jgi:hypothetical protein